MQSRNSLKGRPRRLFVLDYGLFKVNAGAGRVIGISGFLVQTDCGEHVVIDSGFPAKYADDPVAAAREDRLDEFGQLLEFSHENLPLAQLRRIGCDEADVDLFIISHTHIDHAGGLELFPRSPLLIAAAERLLPRPLYWGCVQPIAWPARDYRLIEGDTQIGDGFTILLVPGHAPGQLAFLLELPETGAVLLASDAISRPAEITEGFAGTPDADLALASARRLMRLAEERDAFVIYGHSPAFYG